MMITTALRKKTLTENRSFCWQQQQKTDESQTTTCRGTSIVVWSANDITRA